MKTTGENKLLATPQEIWPLLTEAEQLKHIIPGCQSIIETGEDLFTAVVSLGISVVRGTYKLEIQLAEQQFPNKLTLGIHGTGSTGFLELRMTVELRATGEKETLLMWDSDAQVGGLLMNIGNRMLGSVANHVTTQFLKNLEHLVNSKSAPA